MGDQLHGTGFDIGFMALTLKAQATTTTTKIREFVPSQNLKLQCIQRQHKQSEESIHEMGESLCKPVRLMAKLYEEGL